MNGQVTLNGDGVRVLSCTASNTAVDPNGLHNSATSQLAVHIDEAPPVMSVEPQNPNDPTGLAVNTADGESGVAAGSIEMARAGTGTWASLPTTFTGSQLQAHFDDSGLHGQYDFRSRSCDNVGNCATTTKTLTLPVRVAASSEVTVGKFTPAASCPSSPATGDAGAFPRPRPRPSGGAGLPALARHRRSRAASDRGMARAACASPVTRLATRARIRYGHALAVHGVLMSSAGLPIAGQQVDVLTAPDDRSGKFAQAAVVTTGPDGGWSTTLPAGPSRIVQAAYPGSATILPATGKATVVTPARVVITNVSPRRLAWGGTVTITGRVLGGYVPQSSKLLRLDLGAAGDNRLEKLQGIPNISPDGRFTAHYRFARGLVGIARLWFMVSTLSEADFPFAPAHSRKVIVTVGVHRRAAYAHRRHSYHHKRFARRGASATRAITARKHHHQHHHRHHRHDRHHRHHRTRALHRDRARR